jgi:CRP/FNR family transcriptional regulator, cyclic AMP receptor protein
MMMATGPVVAHDARSEAAEMLARLGRWPFFRDVSHSALGELTQRLGLQTYDAGQIVFLAGDLVEQVYWVERGFAVLRQTSPEGREYILDYVGPGRSLNLAASVDGGPQLATAGALSDLSLLVIERDALTALLRKHADLALAVARRLAQDARQLSETARGLALDSVRQRLALFLLEHAEQAPPQERWTQDRIAAHIGTVRDVVGRILRDFAQEGLVQRERGQLVIVDRQGLEREAGGAHG